MYLINEFTAKSMDFDDDGGLPPFPAPGQPPEEVLRALIAWTSLPLALGWLLSGLQADLSGNEGIADGQFREIRTRLEQLEGWTRAIPKDEGFGDRLRAAVDRDFPVAESNGTPPTDPEDEIKRLIRRYEDACQAQCDTEIADAAATTRRNQARDALRDAIESLHEKLESNGEVAYGIVYGGQVYDITCRPVGDGKYDRHLRVSRVRILAD